MRVPAVVGSWPEPFVHGFQGKHYAVNIVCDGSTKVEAVWFDGETAK